MQHPGWLKSQTWCTGTIFGPMEKLLQWHRIKFHQINRNVLYFIFMIIQHAANIWYHRNKWDRKINKIHKVRIRKTRPTQGKSRGMLGRGSNTVLHNYNCSTTECHSSFHNHFLLFVSSLQDKSETYSKWSTRHHQCLTR